LVRADVQLFVRGCVSSRRTSAVAGFASGLPVVGQFGDETGFPVYEAGVRLVPIGDAEGLSRELISVLRSDQLRYALAARSKSAAQNHFSWDRIAGQYVRALAESPQLATRLCL